MIGAATILPAQERGLPTQRDGHAFDHLPNRTRHPTQIEYHDKAETNINNGFLTLIGCWVTSTIKSHPGRCPDVVAPWLRSISTAS